MTKEKHSEASVPQKLLSRLLILQKGLRTLSSIVPARRLPLLTPAQAYGPDIERFRDSAQSLVSWRDKQSQWWHFRGILTTPKGRRLGWALSIIDRHLQNDFVGAIPARWITPRTFAAWFELCDPMNGEAGRAFLYWQRGGLLRGSRGFAADDRFHVELDGWHAFRREDGTITVFAAGGGDSVHLELKASKPLAFHGQSGYAQKGADANGEAAFYCSYPRLETTGRIVLDGRLEDVTGTAWMDHEKLTARDNPLHSRWERLVAQLADGHDLVLLGDGDRFTSGSWISPEGEVKHLVASDISVENLEYWISPRTGSRYPVKREIRIEPLGLTLSVRPSLSDQELDLTRTTLSTHWEGLVHLTGTRGAAEVTGHGFMEQFGLDPRARARVVQLLTRG